MTNLLKNCWEIMKCGREKGGVKVAELGECIASKEQLGHSCWAIAGTLGINKLDGTMARSRGSCLCCEVYNLYNRSLGSHAGRIKTAFPMEQKKYAELISHAIVSDC